jgi:DNA-binding XRE family transcriptional regulator
MAAIILPFVRHAGSSTSNSSKASSGIRPSDALIIGMRQRWGTERRQRHFLSACGPTPNDVATSSTTSQSSSMTEKDRDRSSPRQETSWDRVSTARGSKIVLMEKDDDENTPAASEYRRNLLRRTKELRENSGYTQAEMADFLNIKVEAYKKYENRSLLPHRFIHKFCRLVKVTEELFLEGKQQAAVRFPQLPAGEKAMRLGRRGGRKRTG